MRRPLKRIMARWSMSLALRRSPDMFERAEHVKALFKAYGLASKALVFAQKGKRRAHGFSLQMQ